MEFVTEGHEDCGRQKQRRQQDGKSGSHGLACGPVSGEPHIDHFRPSLRDQITNPLLGRVALSSIDAHSVVPRPQSMSGAGIVL
jgi:hypothetical protein